MWEITLNNYKNVISAAINDYQQNQYKSVISKLKKINLSKKLCTYQSLSISGSAMTKVGDYSNAAQIFLKALNIAISKEDKISMLNALGKCHYKLSESKIALNYFQQSYALDSSFKNVEVRVWLCRICAYRQLFDEVEKMAPTLFNHNDYFIEAHFFLFEVAKRKQNKVEALSWLKKIASNHNIATAKEKVRTIFEYIRLNEVTEAKKCLSYFSSEDNAYRLATEACIMYEEKNYSGAVKGLTNDLINKVADIMETHILLHYKAQALDKLGNYAEAYSNYDLLANLQKEKSNELRRNDVVDSMRKIDLSSLPHSLNNDNFSLAFFIGFPRSGTTLLDTIIDTQDSVKVISEGGFIGKVARYFREELNLKYPQDLAKTSTGAIEDLRQLYINYVKERVGNDFKNFLVIDKLPLYTIHIPLLKMLFPTAKFVFSVRHPMDVCLSNFQQNYALNDQMAHLLTLKDCAGRYVKVLTLFDKYQSGLELDIHFIKYEELVKNIQQEIQKLTHFLNVELNDNYLNFHAHSQHKVIDTPSRDQVSAKLYSTSMNKWKNYEEQCKPLLAQLMPYINKFGYKL
jgi:tetratricopeptide (TPR) repeat protein